MALDVRDYGAKGDGAADDTDAITRVLSDVAALPASRLSPSRFTTKPPVYFPAGVYRVTAPLPTITARGLRFVGDGSSSSAILYDCAADEPVFSVGTFSATPGDAFTGGTQGASFAGLRIQNANPGRAGSRKGQGIRSVGGSVTLDDVAVLGMRYGLNAPYGGDFNTYTNVLAEYCDTGIYQGPGGQQFIATNANMFGCVEGMVLDRWGHAHLTMPTFNSCERAGLLIESTGYTTTRQLTAFSPSGTSYQSKLVVQTPWFESNAGGMGVGYVSTNFVEISNLGNDAYRDIEIVDPYIVAGEAVGKRTTAFAANTAGFGAQRLAVRRPVFQGGMTRWFTNPSRWTLESPRTTNGYDSPATANTTGGFVALS